MNRYMRGMTNGGMIRANGTQALCLDEMRARVPASRLADDERRRGPRNHSDQRP